MSRAEAQLALLRAHPGPMSGRKKTWADIMSDDDSDDGDFLEQSCTGEVLRVHNWNMWNKSA